MHLHLFLLLCAQLWALAQDPFVWGRVPGKKQLLVATPESSRDFELLLQSKNMHVKLTGKSKLSQDVCKHKWLFISVWPRDDLVRVHPVPLTQWLLENETFFP